MQEDLLAISDGKLYGQNDMVKVECHDCKGCHACCEDMGESVILDPYDVWQLTNNMGKSFDELLMKEVELHVEDGLIYPNLAMGEKNQCTFLNEEGRCSIHGYRPGICRLFPLGRNYEPDRLQYFVLKDACPAPGKTKVKVNKWMGICGMKEYEGYLVRWHNLVKTLRESLAELLEQENGEEICKAVSLRFLQIFYRTPYGTDNFYEEWEKRMQQWQTMTM